jgi:hypothetical protein
MEVLSSKKLNSTDVHNEIVSLNTDQSNHIDFVNQFKDIRKNEFKDEAK